MNKKVGIIGAGAAGMMAAIQAARSGGEVTLFEKNERIGKKILMTGNGKCNLTNKSFSLDDYNSTNKEFLSVFFSRFGVEDTIVFFQELGLLLKNKAGYLYPLSEQASTVLDVLRFEIKRLEIQTITEEEVTSLHRKKDFLVQTKKQNYHFDNILIATGGKACPKSGSDGTGFQFASKLGHHIIDPVPALVQLKCSGDFWKLIAGVRCDANIKLTVGNQEKAVERGELQITDYGISGIPIFQLSRYAAYGIQSRQTVNAFIDFLPDYSLEDLLTSAQEHYKIRKQDTAEEFFTGYLNKKLMFLFMKLVGIKANSLTKNNPFGQIQKVFEQMKEYRVVITDTNSFQNAQVCAGGVPLTEITEKMESNIVKGLYFAGEILDVDGRCGGYNLQWAWTSGYLAGLNMAKE